MKAELTLRASLLGIFLGLIFNIGNTYLGLKVGMTVSASIPAAVLSMAILRLFFKKVSILENNMVQTIASVGEGVAAGIIFTIPAIFLLGSTISNVHITVLAFFGGMLGILFMIPMRRYIIVKEHGVLPFPEGKACAEILKAGGSKISQALLAIYGILLGGIYKFFTEAMGYWSSFIAFPFKETEFRLDGDPALLGVGYIIGPRIAALTFAGGALGWWIMIPLLKMYASANVVFYPGTIPIGQMHALDIWSNYIRYIAIGTVAVGGLYSLGQILPIIGKTVHVGFRELFSTKSHTRGLVRTDQDISMRWLIIGSLSIIALLYLFPGLNFNLFTIVLLVLLGYFFVAVTSLTVGIVGSSSNPASGMVLTTLLITCALFVFIGWTERVYLLMAITMGAVVTVTICLAATTSQDLKTGFLVGATPRKQQLGEMIGLVAPSLVIGVVIHLLNQAYGFGSPSLPAPQATLLAIVGSGIIHQELPMALIFLGVVLGVIILLLRIRVLPFAIGLYLPLEITTAIFIGGVVRFLVAAKKVDESPGILAGSGLVAGNACVGVIIALLSVLGLISQKVSLVSPLFSLAAFLFLTSLFLFLSLKSNPS